MLFTNSWKKKLKEKEEKRERKNSCLIFLNSQPPLLSAFLLHYESNMHLCQTSLLGCSASYCPLSWGMKQNWGSNKSHHKRQYQRPRSGLLFSLIFLFLSVFFFFLYVSVMLLAKAFCRSKKLIDKRQLIPHILSVTCPNQLN